MSARTLNLLTLVALSATLVAVTGCSGDDPAAAEPAPILTITNSWGEEGQSDHDFNFASSDDGEDSGAFTGQEVTPESDVFDLSGTWANGRVEFTVERTAGDVTYTASFSVDNPERLVFRNDADRNEELVLLLGG